MSKFPTAMALFIAQNRQPKEQVKDFLWRVLSSPKLSDGLLEVIFQNPRDNHAVFQAVCALWKTPAEKLRFLNKYNNVYPLYIKRNRGQKGKYR